MLRNNIFLLLCGMEILDNYVAKAEFKKKKKKNPKLSFKLCLVCIKKSLP